MLYNHGEPVATCQKHHIRARSYVDETSAYRKTIHIPELEEASRELLDHLDWHGFASVQFRQDGEYRRIYTHEALLKPCCHYAVLYCSAFQPLWSKPVYRVALLTINCKGFQQSRDILPYIIIRMVGPVCTGNLCSRAIGSRVGGNLGTGVIDHTDRTLFVAFAVS